MREDVLNKCVPDHFLTRGEDEGGLYLRNNARFWHIKQDSLNFKKSQCKSYDLNNVWQPLLGTNALQWCTCFEATYF